MNNKDKLREKLRKKINEKRIQTGRPPLVNINNVDLDSNEAILEMSKQMIRDCELQYIKRLNVRQKYNIMEKKYKHLKNNYIPIFRSILNGEISMNNIGMLEMMLEMREKNVSYDDMNNFLAEKYMLDKDEESKDDKINCEEATKELKNYLDKKEDKDN